jgi:hypothetical protein
MWDPFVRLASTFPLLFDSAYPFVVQEYFVAENLGSPAQLLKLREWIFFEKPVHAATLV